MRRSLWISACVLLALGGALAAYLALTRGGAAQADLDREPVQGGDAAEMKALIDTIIRAHGGEANLARFHAATMTTEGTIQFWGRHRLKEVMSVQLPDRLRIESTASVMTLTKVLAGDRGWLKRNNNQAEEMTGGLLAEGHVWFYLLKLSRTLLPLRDRAATLAPLGEQAFDGRRVVGVQIVHPGLLPINLFVDRETRLLARAEGRFAETVNREVPLVFSYSEYEVIDGIQFYRKMSVQREGKPYMESNFTRITLQDKLPDRLFERP